MYEIDPDSIDPWRLARKVGIGITRGKEFYAGHLYKGGLVSALFIDAQDCFSFDVVVDPAHQAKGLGAELVDVAISEFDTAENYFDWDDEYAPESYEYCVEVVNPHMKRLLERKGFYVHETSTDGNSWLMRRARQNPQNLPIYVNNLGIHTNAPIPLYHGSPRLIEQFKPTPHYLAEGEAVVFGTPFIEIAVSCMRFWTDDDFEQGIVGDDPPYMIEQYPGAFEEIYGGKQGYLYELASDTFVRSEALARFELFSYEPPKIISSYVCDDVLKLLKSTDMQMVDFEDRDAYIQKGYRR
jgi:GNAT superfamily N-acetyltransferase